MRLRKRSIQYVICSIFIVLYIGHFLYLGGEIYTETFLFSPQSSHTKSLIRLTSILLIDSLCLWLLYKALYQPLLKLVGISSKLLNTTSSRLSSAKIKLPEIASHLEDFQNNQIKIIEFLEEIGKNNFEANPDIDTNSKMGQTLINMRSQLKSAAASEQIHHWKNQGISYFTKIIREEQTNLQTLTQVVLSKLVKYMEANQGAVFVLEEDEDASYLELKATFAWEKDKHQEKRFELQQGLAGQAVIERETIYLTDVPPAYIHITSGLGEALPNQLLIVPMQFNEKVHGVIELASFKKFEKYQIELIEAIGEILASSLSTIKVSEQTQKLLQESRQMTEMMKSQEEELRNNALEMETARQNLSVELNKATAEMERQIETIEQERRKNIAILESYVDGVVTFNISGTIEFINKAAEQIWNTSRNLVIGKPITKLIPLSWMDVDGKKTPQYNYQGTVKPIDIRTEVAILNQEQEEVAVLMTISHVNVGGEDTYTIFIQKVSVELF
ncbi:GAF domain-containing protein [Catalinimonas niigatensis]|uniref:GAF domain-containing protein n=1 Tax=Catalinimonas niigatensis TaxID=1397264 RepID=UPI002666721D|nr:GAF domain-containing protein [Catalinimonas niigatensis]WPP53540.1 GAF domain-containing protein [Catalinimonas niigatensis]